MRDYIALFVNALYLAEGYKLMSDWLERQIIELFSVWLHSDLLRAAKTHLRDLLERYLTGKK